MGNGHLQAMRADQLAPHSAEAEQAVLGSILIDISLLDQIRAIITPEDFFIVRHQWIYEAILTLKGRGHEVDHLTVMVELESRGRAEQLGGISYLLDLLSYSGFSVNVGTYARIIQAMAIRRRLIQAGGQIARLAHSEEMDIDTVINKSIDAVTVVNGDYVKTIETTKSIGDLLLAGYVKAREWRENPAPFRGLSTGYDGLDRAIGGLKEEQMSLLCGRPSMGKSALAASIARQIALRGGVVLYFSMEDSADVLSRRMVCQEARVPIQGLENGTLSDSEWDRYEQANIRLMNTIDRNLFIEEQAGLTVEQMTAIADNRLRDSGRLDLVIVDTGNKVTPKVGGKLYERMTDVSHDIARWAKNKHLRILVTVQLNRGATDRPEEGPTLSQLRDSGAWEEDARLVISLHRPAYYNKRETDPQKLEETFVQTLKNTNGDGTGYTKLAWRPEYTGFERVDRYEIVYDDTTGRYRAEEI